MKPIAIKDQTISQIQIEADKAVFELSKIKSENEEIKILMSANCLVNFNLIYWWGFIFPMVTDFEILDFLIKNSPELKRKMKFQEFVDFSEKFRLLKSHKQNPNNFTEFKECIEKIKLIEN